MKRKFLAVCIALFSINAPVMAKDGKSCEAESSKLPPQERSAYIKRCLAQLNDPVNVKQEQQQSKQVRCEQNAKNQNLQGNAKASYISSCMNKDEAAAAAAKVPTSQANTSTTAAKPAKHATGKTNGSKPAKSCVKQANQKGLKGDERKQFLKDCK